MKKSYQLNNKLLKRLIRQNLILLVGMLVFAPIIGRLKGIDNFEYSPLFIGVLLGVVLLFNIPAIWLFINYYIENRGTEVEIDIQSGFIKISQNGNIKNYGLGEIETSIYNIGIYYKNRIDNNKRWAAIHSDFGYWDVKFKNGDRYYISNLVVDFLHDPAFLFKTKYRFRFFPYIDKASTKKGVEHAKQNVIEKSRVEKFVEQYETKNEIQLREILDNKKSYQKEAVEAAEIVFDKKFTGRINSKSS